MENPTFEEIVSEHAAFVRGTLARFGVSSRDREDLMQDVWQVVARKLPCFDPSIAVRAEGAMRAWLFTICEVLAASHRRARCRRTELLMETQEIDDRPSNCRTAEDRLSTAEERVLAMELVEALERKRRAVLTAYMLNGMAMVDVAALLGIPVNTAWNCLRLALEELRAAWRRIERGKG